MNLTVNTGVRAAVRKLISASVNSKARPDRPGALLPRMEVLMKRLTKAGWLLAVLMLMGALVQAAAPDRGAAKITLDGGSYGKVHFPHRRHQEKMAACDPCHDLFPQEAGSIRSLKASGKLGPKVVMKTKCIACHKTKKAAREKTGPTGCRRCHQK